MFKDFVTILSRSRRQFMQDVLGVAGLISVFLAVLYLPPY